MDYFLILYSVALFVSLAMLWFSGGFSVRCSVEMASLFKIRTLFIGFVLIAVSTGLPELSVSISSLLRNVPGISAGTILGSNISNLSMVLGISILFYGTIYIRQNENRDSLLMLIITTAAMVLVFSLDVLSRTTGLFLIFVYIGSIAWLWNNRTQKEMKEEIKVEEKVVEEEKKPGPKPFFESKLGVLVKFFVSIILVLISSEIAVYFAIKLSSLLNLSLETVGATVFAVGTSLPELSLSLNAIKKKEYALAIGNSLGSVLEQGTLLLGLLAFFSPQPIDIKPLRSLAPFMFISFAIMAFGMIKRKKISRIEGGLLLFIFGLFLIYQIGFVR
jgi:cation:H+ antiporter